MRRGAEVPSTTQTSKGNEMSHLIKPAFVTKAIAEQAVEAAIAATIGNPEVAPQLGRLACHIVVMVRARTAPVKSSLVRPNAFQPVVLFEKSVGNPDSDWSRDYKAIATGKALILLEERQDDRMVAQPCELYEGDTIFWGGARHGSIATACSGFKPHFDQMASNTALATCVSLTQEAWLKWYNSFEDKDRPSFVPANM
jgi:hypothetical protein